MKKYKSIKENTNAELVVKKSRFMSYIFYVKSVKEIEVILKGIKKEYYDCKHICYAYSVVLNENETITKSSDDGEPSGTAGAPMLNIITKSNLNNVLIVVVRYFGGVLLGTGGLVKAYTDVSLMALEKVDTVYEEFGKEILLEVTYSQLKTIRYFLKKEEIFEKNIVFEDMIKITLEVNDKQLKKINENIVNKSIQIENFRVIKNCIIRKNVDI